MLDKIAKSTGSKRHHYFNLDLQQQHGVVQEGVRPFEVQLRNQDLPGLFSHHGVRPEDESGVRFLGNIPIVAHMFKSQHSTGCYDLELLILVTPKLARIEDN